jgi:hypothetical protein
MRFKWFVSRRISTAEEELPSSFACMLASAVASQALQLLMTATAACHAQELELGREFVFHSVFACPVSREQSSPDNPPMLLPCGHVLAKQSLQKIAKSPMRSFKCPYCPVEATLNGCRAIFFPDA